LVLKLGPGVGFLAQGQLRVCRLLCPWSWGIGCGDSWTGTSTV